MLDADAAEDPHQRCQHLDLARRVRREVGVAALRRGRHEPAVDVVQHRFAEAGARGDHRGVAVRAARRPAAAPPARPAPAPGRRRPAPRDRSAGWHRAGGRVRSATRPASTSHGTLVSRATWSVTAPATPKHAASICRGLTFCALQELADHRLEAVVVERDELADVDRRGRSGSRREEPEQRLGAADVAREQHGVIHQLARCHVILNVRSARPRIAHSRSSSVDRIAVFDAVVTSGGPFGVRDIRSLYPSVTENHLRYLEKWGLVRASRQAARRASTRSPI